MKVSNKLKTFVRYDVKGIIVPGSAILSREVPKNGIWKEIFMDIDYGNSVYNNLKAFIEYTKENTFIPSSNILLKEYPNNGRWKQINIRNNYTTITTTTIYECVTYITDTDGNRLITNDGDYIIL